MQASTKSFLIFCGCPAFCRSGCQFSIAEFLRYRGAETRHRKEGSIRAGRVFCSVTRAVSEEPYIHLGEIDSCQYQFNSIYSVNEKQVHVIKCGIVQYSQ